MAEFAQELERAKAERVPVMALRRHEHDGTMDDVVVEAVSTFRAEQLDTDYLWMACYFPNGERVTFHVHASRSVGRKVVLDYDVGEMPKEWIDWDTRRLRAGTDV